MSAFQLITIPLLLLFFTATAAATLRRRMKPRAGAFWSLLWAAAATAIAWPEMTVRAARLLGIGRGADLVLYLAVVSMAIGFFLVFVRLRRIEENLTKLVRTVEMNTPAEPPAPPTGERVLPAP